MKQEDKDLVYKDLCARLPYNVCINCTEEDDKDTNFDCTLMQNMFADYLSPTQYWVIKPYLRPMSSMTENERKDWFKYSCVDYDCEFKPEPTLYVGYCHLSVDWLNAHHFDYRGLIEKGLALEAPKYMYEEK